MQPLRVPQDQVIPNPPLWGLEHSTSCTMDATIRQLCTRCSGCICSHADAIMGRPRVVDRGPEATCSHWSWPGQMPPAQSGSKTRSQGERGSSGHRGPVAQLRVSGGPVQINHVEDKRTGWQSRKCHEAGVASPMQSITKVEIPTGVQGHRQDPQVTGRTLALHRQQTGVSFLTPG